MGYRGIIIMDMTDRWADKQNNYIFFFFLIMGGGGGAAPVCLYKLCVVIGLFIIECMCKCILYDEV